MGLFSSKKKTNVYTATQKLVDDADFKYSSQYAMQDYLFSKNPGDLVDLSIEYQNNAMPRKMRRILAFSKKPDGYVFGLPTNNKLVDNKDSFIEKVKGYLATEEVNPINFIYVYVGDKDFNHFAWNKLVNTFGYSFANNELTTLSIEKGTPCYLFTGQITYTQNTLNEYEDILNENTKHLSFDYGKCFDRPLNLTTTTPHQQGEKDLFTFQYQYQGAAGIVTESRTISMADINPDNYAEDDYVQSIYIVNDVMKIFTYKLLSGTNPGIDSLLDLQNKLGTYFPRLYVKLNKTDILDSSDELRKSHTKKYCRVLGLNLADLTENINKGLGDNKGITRDVFLSFMVRINDDKDNQITGEYLYKYFSAVYNDTKPVMRTETYSDIFGGTHTREVEVPGKHQGTSYLIADNVCTQHIIFDSIYRKEYSGQVLNNQKNKLDVGEYTVEQGELLFEEGMAGFASVVDLHRIYYQKSEDKYVVLTVTKLRTTIDVVGHTATLGTTNEELAIPLDLSILDDIGEKAKEYLYSKCLHTQLSLLKVTKVKWYQTGVFKVVMALVGIAISIATAGAGTPLVTVLTQAAMNTIIGIAVGEIVSLAIKLAVKLGLSERIAQALGQIVEFAVIVYSQRGSFKNLLSADNLMKTMNTAFAIYEKQMQITVNRLQTEYERLAKYYEDKADQIEEVKKALLTKHIPLSMDLLMDKEGSNTNTLTLSKFGETPEDFYTRSMFYDITGLDVIYINNYVDIASQLPSYQDTQQKLIYKQNEDTDIQSGLLI
mgnify:FL=1